MTGGAVAALVIGGVVVVGGGVGAVLYFRHRGKLLAAAAAAPGRVAPGALSITPNVAAGTLMAGVGPAVATGGSTKTSAALNTLERYQHGLDNAVGNLAGGFAGRYLGSAGGNMVGTGIKTIAHYANPITVTKDVNKVLGKISSKLNPAHWF